MIEIRDLKVSLTLTIGELQELVALMNLAGETFPEGHAPKVIEEISTMYFDLMENLEDGYLGEFEPEE